MKPIPQTENALVLRADFSDDEAWESICKAIRQPAGDFQFQAIVDFLSEPDYDGLEPQKVVSLIREGSQHTFIFVVDHTTFSNPDHPILCIDLCREPGRTFRVIPSEMWGVENNLSIANMSFDEFADSVDQDGIFRGFPES